MQEQINARELLDRIVALQDKLIDCMDDTKNPDKVIEITGICGGLSQVEGWIKGEDTISVSVMDVLKEENK